MHSQPIQPITNCVVLHLFESLVCFAEQRKRVTTIINTNVFL